MANNGKVIDAAGTRARCCGYAHHDQRSAPGGRLSGGRRSAHRPAVRDTLIAGVADLPGNLQVIGEWTAGGGLAIEEKKTCGPGESACARGGIDARLGGAHPIREIKEVHDAGLQLALIGCDGQVTGEGDYRGVGGREGSAGEELRYSSVEVLRL